MVKKKQSIDKPCATCFVITRVLGMSSHHKLVKGQVKSLTLPRKDQSFLTSAPPFGIDHIFSCRWVGALGLVLASQFTTLAADFTSLCADRAGIERVYYRHRLGTKPPFEQTLPTATLENLVRLDLNKEAALQKTYGVTIAPAQLAAEVQRINTTTQSPEILAELKSALGHDPEKFATTFAKPILVERELRQRFDNDDALHAPQRREVEQARHELLVARTNGASPAQLLARFLRAHTNLVTETTWQLGAPPEEKSAAPSADEIEIKKRFGPEAQILSSPHAGPDKERKIYFEELPAELQKVLRVQLRRAGDVSAVIETPGGFLLYLAKEKTEAVLSVAGYSLPKRSYEGWLAEQNKGERSPR
jgi:hypothetical protein